MLESLTIRQVALIDDVTIRFHKGMQVMTGETGAGKSIVVDSVNLILGGRADRELIRTGSDKASVEAVFIMKDNRDIQTFMEQEGIEYDGETVTIYREITTSGRNLCRICGIVLPVSRLKDLAAILLDIHGQNEHQFLADPAKHLAFLDQLGDEKHRELLMNIRREYELFISNHRAYAKLVRQNENRDTKIRLLERDIEELRKANIRPGEKDILTEKRKRLDKAEKETGAIRNISEQFTGGEGSNSLSSVRQAADALKALAVQDDSVREISERCESLYYELEDIAYQISIMLQNTEFEPEALEKTEDRLDLIRRLERKYSTDADRLSDVLSSSEEEYRQLVNIENEIEQMATEHRKLLIKYRNTAKILSESRQKLASNFESKMMKELNDLGMANTRFKVEFKDNNTGRPLMPTENGDDRIEFLISPNPGEPLKPLARIASGGELSRLMLALKSLESDHSGVESMIFDEIDTGISGHMAQVVAEKMIKISCKRQVICVTHLPQIAAASDYQYLVHKSVTEGRTNTLVSELDETGRIREVSRMISGADGITSESEAYALRMIRVAKELKQKMLQ